MELTKEQIKWAKNASRRYRKYGKGIEYWRNLIIKQNAKCNLSGVDLIFKKEDGTSKKGGEGCHPLYAAVDHVKPGDGETDFQIICYDLNDLKGHLPFNLFNALRKTKEWFNFINDWNKLADEKPLDREAFKRLIRKGFLD